uniref:Uncharacterized protein n=1 Tax=Pithovirus LCPAC202 TaxID=2506592 RepID=A0A481Z5A8_9VIRU|nr:MAG: hypothetical protein LCPAC202_00220 [Pithovirus LCPAC202]
MSLWILTYIDINNPHYTDQVGLYKTKDEAVNETINSFGRVELYETPDGKIWFHSDEFIGLPIELKDLRKRIKKNGFLDLENAWNDKLFDCEKYHIITEIKVTGNSKMMTRKAKLLTEQHKCSDCKGNFNIHRFGGSTIIELSPGCPRCRDCSSTGSLIQEYRDKWYCSDMCKQSKHKQISSEEQNEELRRPGQNFHGPPGSKKQTILNVEHYRKSDSGGSKAYQSENGIIFVERGGGIIAIGLDIENDGLLKMISTVKHSSFLQELGIKIDEGWRKGNKKPVLFSDYLKIISQEKN